MEENEERKEEVGRLKDRVGEEWRSGEGDGKGRKCRNG